MSRTASSANRWSVRDSLCLALAIAIHALLLLIPNQEKALPSTDSAPLNITLLAPRLVESPFLDEVMPEMTEVPAVDNRTIAQNTRPEPEFESPESIEKQTEPEPTGAKVLLTTARLLDSANEMEWSRQDKDNTRQLGVFVPRALPDNWRPGNAFSDPIFQPMVLSGKTEVVDRWLEADGSQSVIVTSPGGETLCGRASAWDPMRPMIEHVMQFRLCSSGERRSVEMVQRIKRLSASPL